MQCNMRNQCSGLFTCIMDYLHVLCTILMVLSCVLCMTLMVFVYFYYGLFACINLVDVMPLFSTVFFLSIYRFSAKFARFLKNSPKNRHDEFWYCGFLLFLSHLQCVSTEFSRISPFFPIFPKIDGIA
jgi:hypothetical protein